MPPKAKEVVEIVKKASALDLNLTHELAPLRKELSKYNLVQLPNGGPTVKYKRNFQKKRRSNNGRVSPSLE